MKIFCTFILVFILGHALVAQTTQTNVSSAWEVVAKDINPDNYFGVTVANGVIGLVSSAEPLKVKDVVMNGTYDYYQRGRVSNILKIFNHVNMNLDVDRSRIGPDQIENYQQKLNMKEAALETTFDVPGKVCLLYTSPSPRDRG